MRESRRLTQVLPSCKIVNVVVSTKIDRQVNVELLTEKLPHVVYEPEIFPGVIYRRNDPKATIIMFSTGKIVSVGSKSEDSARKSISTTVSEIAEIEGEKAGFKRITTENIVATSDVGCEVDIEKAANCVFDTTYEPEQFPGLIYRVKGNGVVTIFKSGKLVSTGSKSESKARSAIQHVYKILRNHDCLISPAL